MRPEENLALVGTIYDLWNKRDLERAVDLVTDDVEIRLVALGQTLTDRDGFRRFMERFAAASSDMKKEVTNQAASSDQVVSEFTLRGTHDGPLRPQAGEMPATGRRPSSTWWKSSGSAATRSHGSGTTPTRQRSRCRWVWAPDVDRVSP